MGRRRSPEWVWRQIWWPQTFTPEFAVELLDRVAADRELGAVVFEARAHHGIISYFVGVRPHHVQSLSFLITSHVPGVRLDEPRSNARPHAEFASRLKVSHPSLALNVDRVTATTRAVLAGLASTTDDDETVVLQIVMGTRLSPRFISPNAPTQRNTGSTFCLTAVARLTPTPGQVSRIGCRCTAVGRRFE